jgi:quinol monooxygenase YgiN
MSQRYTSAQWKVRAGNEARFIEAWTEFLQWTRKDHSGMVRAQLIRNEQEPQRFTSFAEWTDESARAAWRASPEFQSKLAECRELCEEFTGLDYTETVTI